MTTTPPRPVHPNPSLHRDVCGVARPGCHGVVRPFPRGRRCQHCAPQAIRKTGRHLTVVKP